MSENPASGDPPPTSPPNDAELLQAALDHFNAQQYEQCAETLSRIQLTPANETKIAHNRAVALFYASQMRDTNALRSQLDALLPTAAAAAAAATDALADVDPLPEDPLHIGDTSMLTLYFNRAVVLFHSRQTRASLRILTGLVPHLAEMDDALAQRCGLLTIHLHLLAHRTDEARSLVDRLQQRLQSTAPELLPGDDFDDDDAAGPNAPAAVDEDNNRAPPPVAAKTPPAAGVDGFRRMLRLYKLRCSVLAGRNVPMASEDTGEMSVLRAHQFYNGIDYQMAAKELSKPFDGARATLEANGEDHNTVIANDMAIVHFHVRHYALAVRFFQNALTFEQLAQDRLQATARPLPLQCAGASKRPDIMYNLGIAMLHLQRPHEAFECLLVALPHYLRNPRAWLRVAEACIMVHRQRVDETGAQALGVTTAGVGAQRKFLLKPSACVRLTEEPLTFSNPTTSLEFAALCLHNANDLTEVQSAKLVAAATTAGAAGTTTTPPEASAAKDPASQGFADCLPSKPLTESAFRNLRMAILAASAYVSLSLGEYQLTRRYCRRLACMPALPHTYSLLAHLYCAEALLKLDRVMEARKVIEPNFMNELKEDDFVHRGGPDWPVNTIEGVQWVIRYNQSVTLLLQGDEDLARSVLARCMLHPLTERCAKAALLYLEVRSGNLDACRKMIFMDAPQLI